VTGHRAVFHRSRPDPDRDDVRDLTAPAPLGAGVTGTADRPPRAQMREQLPLQHPTGLNEQAAIDRLMRHVPGRIIRIAALEPTGDLLGRPVPLELPCHRPAQARITRQLTCLRPPRHHPSPFIGACRTIASRPAVALDLAADRRRRTTQTAGNRPQRLSDRNPSGDLLSLGQRQRQPGTRPFYGADPASRPQVIEYARGRLAQDPADRLQSFALLPAIPQLRRLRWREPHTDILLSHRNHSTSDR
jgi:hypothetical protein